MNNIIRAAAIVGLVAATACSGPTTYEINGRVAGATTGDTVYLVNPRGVDADTTIMTDSTFSFAGSLAEEDSVCYQGARYTLRCARADGRTIRGAIFLEHGQPTIEMTENGWRVAGTPMNDAYQKVQDEAEPFMQTSDDLYNKSKEPNLDEAMRKDLEAQSEVEYEKYRDVIRNGAKAHMNSPVGLFLLKEVVYDMDGETLSNMLSNVPAKCKNEPTYIRLNAQAEALKRVALGQDFVDLTLLNPDSAEVSLSQYVGKGKVVLLDFWASWCLPCRRLAPSIVELYKANKDKGFEIVGLSMDRKMEAWQKSIVDLGLEWPQMSDLNGWSSLAAKEYAIMSIPTTILVDGNGKIIGRYSDEESMKKAVEEALK